MKKYIAILTLIYALSHFHANSQQLQTNPLTIDQFDTIFFDLSAAAVVGSTVEFPVYYKSDDQVVALDFNFKYNHNKLDYDTIVKLANYLDVLSFYNTNDSTVRLTSYTNTLFYPNDSVLFKVKFTVLQPGPLCNGDIFAVNSLLNGDICTSGIVDCTSGLSENSWLNEVTVFPNPATEFVELRGLPIGATYELHDPIGNLVFRSDLEPGSTEHQIKVSQFPAGLYNIMIRKGELFGYILLVKVD
ncbi:MAG: cohesin domain-containing protein [Bacteroidota bacterium]